MSKTFNKNIPYNFSGAINLSTSAGLNITNNSNTIGSIITTGGNVGIGTTAPAYTLDINGTFEASNSNGLLLFASSGNVGIGTTSPNNLVTIRGVTQIGGIPNQGLSGGFRMLRLTPLSGSSTQITFDTSISTGSSQNYIYNDSSMMEFNAPRFYFGQNAGFGANVGIGTTSPATALHVVQPSGTASLSIQNSSSTGNSSIDFFNYSSGYIGSIGFGNTASSSGGAFRNTLFLYHNNQDAVFIGSGTTERMRVTAAGNVGIGTTAPSVKLQVNGNVFNKPSWCLYYLNYPSNGANTYYVQYPNGYNIPFNQNFYEGIVVTKQANTTEFRLNYAGYYLINLQTNIISASTTEHHYAVSANSSSGIMTIVRTAQYGFCPGNTQRVVPGLFTYMINVTTPGNIYFVITPNSLLNNVIQGFAYSTDTMHAVQFQYLGEG